MLIFILANHLTLWVLRSNKSSHHAIKSLVKIAKLEGYDTSYNTIFLTTLHSNVTLAGSNFANLTLVSGTGSYEGKEVTTEVTVVKSMEIESDPKVKVHQLVSDIRELLAKTDKAESEPIINDLWNLLLKSGDQASGEASPNNLDITGFAEALTSKVQKLNTNRASKEAFQELERIWDRLWSAIDDLSQISLPDRTDLIRDELNIIDILDHRSEIEESINVLYQRLRSTIRRLSEDSRNSNLCEILDLITEQKIKPIFLMLKDGSIEEAVSTIDGAMAALFEIKCRINRLDKNGKKIEDGTEIRVYPMNKIYQDSKGQFEILYDNAGNVVGKNYDLPITFAESALDAVAVENYLSDTVRELLSYGVPLEKYSEMYKNLFGKDLKAGIPFDSLSRLRRELQWASTRLGGKEGETNEEFVTELLRIDFGIAKAVGGDICTLLKRILGVEEKPISMDEGKKELEIMKKLKTLFQELDNLLHGNLAEHLSAVRNTEQAIADVPYTLRILKETLTRTKTSLFGID